MYTALIVLLVLVLGGALLLRRAMRGAAAAGKAAEAACPPIGRFVEVSGPTGPLRLHYLEKRPDSDPESADRADDADTRPPVVMIHGLAGSLRHFSATVMDELARDHRVIAVDRPGMGYSDQPPGGPFGVEAQAETLDAFLQTLEIRPPLIVGHSLGGSVALALALRRPVAGLMLLAPATHPFKAKPPTPDRTVDSPFMRRAIAYTIGPDMIAQNRAQSLAVAFGPQQAPAEFAVAGGGVLMMRPRQIETTLADAALLNGALEAQSARYAAIEAPITVLFGDQDGILQPQEHAPPLQAKAPQVKTRIFEGVGHMLPFVRPDETIDAIREMTGARSAEEKSSE